MGTTFDPSKRVFAGPSYDTFSKAYPRIKNIVLKANEHRYEKYNTRLSKNDFRSMIQCSNTACKEGGFEIYIILNELYHKELKEGKGTLLCIGHEPMGRSSSRRCFNSMDYEMAIEYISEKTKS
ncbi:MAG: hypothetical protein KKA90_02310 [Nanoarchaeota archaeon]|nr:hypothetical protein [Nanoarchaeota archaeon]